MTTYLYAKWKSAPADSPVEFYSELDATRWETPKVEVSAEEFEAAWKRATT
jgi:hypothetical protein